MFGVVGFLQFDNFAFEQIITTSAERSKLISPYVKPYHSSAASQPELSSVDTMATRAQLCGIEVPLSSGQLGLSMVKAIRISIEFGHVRRHFRSHFGSLLILARLIVVWNYSVSGTQADL